MLPPGGVIAPLSTYAAIVWAGILGFLRLGRFCRTEGWLCDPAAGGSSIGGSGLYILPTARGTARAGTLGGSSPHRGAEMSAGGDGSTAGLAGAGNGASVGQRHSPELPDDGAFFGQAPTAHRQYLTGALNTVIGEDQPGTLRFHLALMLPFPPGAAAGQPSWARSRARVAGFSRARCCRSPRTILFFSAVGAAAARHRATVLAFAQAAG